MHRKISLILSTITLIILSMHTIEVWGDHPYIGAYQHVTPGDVRITSKVLVRANFLQTNPSAFGTGKWLMALLNVAGGHVSASAAPQPPQSTVPIATIIIIIVMIAVVVAVLGFAAIRKMERP